MKTFVIVLVTPLALWGCALHRAPGSPLVADKLLLTGVTIVNTRDGTLAPQMDVLMDKGRIISITRSTTAANSSARLIDATANSLYLVTTTCMSMRSALTIRRTSLR